MIKNEIINELIAGLQNIFGDKLYSIILYGSVARGEDMAESDIDIALLMKESLDDDTKENFLCWNASMDMKYNKIFSIIDIEKSIFDRWGNIYPLYQNIKNEGIVLWKAAERILLRLDSKEQKKCLRQPERILK